VLIAVETQQLKNGYYAFGGDARSLAVLTNATGQVLKRGHDLAPVLAFFDKKRFQVVD